MLQEMVADLAFGSPGIHFTSWRISPARHSPESDHRGLLSAQRSSSRRPGFRLVFVWKGKDGEDGEDGEEMVRQRGDVR